jgi:multidrug efflux pump subunit AcrA (membrane-fusion protein)
MSRPSEDVATPLRELIALLQLEKMARDADSPDALQFLMVNESRRAVPYEQAIAWFFDTLNRPAVRAVSGISHPDNSAPYMQHLRRVLGHIATLGDSRQLRTITDEDITAEYREDWQAISQGHALWCPFVDADDGILGGLWLTRDTAWTSSETTRLDFLVDCYSHAWQSLGREHFNLRSWLQTLWQQFLDSRRQRLVLAAVLFVTFMPVQQSVIAPAEVVPREPFILSAPVEGVVQAFHVEPGTAVKAGEPIFSLDDRTLKNRHEVALKALEVARADHRRALLKAFKDDESKAEVQLLKSVMDQKAAEVNYTEELLQRIHVRAPRDGIAIYTDPTDWVGRPVKVGERIVTLADPAGAELLIWLPVDDAINLESGAKVRAFLNVAPTHPVKASLRRSSYEAQPSPEDILAFQLRAAFADSDDAVLRIGHKATAKVYGGYVPLVYYVLRRPLSALRQFVGL